MEGKRKGDQSREEEEREIKKDRSYLERVDKTFWGHGFLGAKTKDELKKSHLFYS